MIQFMEIADVMLLHMSNDRDLLGAMWWELNIVVNGGGVVGTIVLYAARKQYDDPFTSGGDRELIVVIRASNHARHLITARIEAAQKMRNAEHAASRAATQEERDAATSRFEEASKQLFTARQRLIANSQEELDAHDP